MKMRICILLLTILVSVTMLSFEASAEIVEVNKFVSGFGSWNGDSVSLDCDASGKCTDSNNQTGYIKDDTFYIEKTTNGTYNYTYYDDGFVKTQTYYGLTTTYEYDDNVVTISESWESSPQYDRVTKQTFENTVDRGDPNGSDYIYSVSNYLADNHTGKGMQLYNEDGNRTGAVYMDFDENGTVINMQAYRSNPWGSALIGYDNGKLSYVQDEDSWNEYKFFYDENGKPVSKATFVYDWSVSNTPVGYTVVETYDFTTDGKLKVCTPDGQSCETTEYTSMEEYALKAYLPMELKDIMSDFSDSNFGQKGYVPSRLGADEYPSAKKRWTPAEAAQIAGEDNTIILYYR